MLIELWTTANGSRDASFQLYTKEVAVVAEATAAV